MKKNWSKILFIASDVILAVYLLFAFTTVSKKSSATTVCSKVDIRIADEMTNGFLDAATVKHNLQKAGCYPVINKPLTDVNTRNIEETLMLHTPSSRQRNAIRRRAATYISPSHNECP